MNLQSLNQEQLLLIAVLVMAILTIALLTTTIILLVKVSNLTKKYNAFMKGSDGYTLESTILNRFKEIDILKDESKYTSEKLNIACETLVTAYQKIGIVKYDAFKEMGGKLSFSLCLLDDENTIIENIDKRLELNQQLKQSIQRLVDRFNMSTDKKQDFTKWLTLYTKIPI